MMVANQWGGTNVPLLAQNWSLIVHCQKTSGQPAAAAGRRSHYQ